jgi:FKBP-type peptidyl-prolyl cis-trans isomerase
MDQQQYLDDHAQKDGVTVTDSGLQYVVTIAGEGAQPGPTDQVTVHYKGSLIDGTVFDSSYDRGQPISFGLNQVIPGWTEGLQLMQEGSKYTLVIPAHLGYGDAGAGGVIPGGATLIFEVELIKVG